MINSTTDLVNEHLSYVMDNKFWVPSVTKEDAEHVIRLGGFDYGSLKGSIYLFWLLIFKEAKSEPIIDEADRNELARAFASAINIAINSCGPFNMIDIFNAVMESNLERKAISEETSKKVLANTVYFASKLKQMVDALRRSRFV